MKRYLLKIKNLIRYVFYWGICLVLPINKKRVLVSSYYGLGYGDNLKYVVEELLKNNDLEIIWLVKNKEISKTLPSKVKCVDINSFKSVYYLATSKVWIDNCRKPFILKKRKSQYYVQTWHGFALKKIEKDAENSLSKWYVKNAKKDSKCIDLIISDSKFMDNIYKNSFWYNGETQILGSPRNDIIIEPKKVKEKVYNYFKLDNSVKTVLYAPTFRADGSLKAYNLDYDKLLKACKERYGEEFVALVRLHPNVINKSSDLTFTSKVINASTYPDMQELLSTVDIVISDYSSLMFDFALSFKPCFQFATDIEEYKKDRDFYFDLNSLPFPLATNNEELFNNIINFEKDSYYSGLKDFYDKVGMNLKGDASIKTAEIINRITK